MKPSTILAGAAFWVSVASGAGCSSAATSGEAADANSSSDGELASDAGGGGAADGGEGEDAGSLEDAGAGAADDSGDAGAAGDAGAEEDAGAADDAGSAEDAGESSSSDGGRRVIITGTVSLLATSSGLSVSGASVEIVGSSPTNSTTADADGGFQLFAAPGTYFVRASQSNALSSQTAVAAPESTTASDLGLLSASLAKSLASYLQISLDATRGIAAVSFSTPDTGGGYGATLSSSAGPTFAISANGLPKLSPTTIAGGRNTLFFVNVAPGATAITFVAPGAHRCEAQVPIGTYRIDPNVITEILATCH